MVVLCWYYHEIRTDKARVGPRRTQTHSLWRNGLQYEGLVGQVGRRHGPSQPRPPPGNRVLKLLLVHACLRGSGGPVCVVHLCLDGPYLSAQIFV